MLLRSTLIAAHLSIFAAATAGVDSGGGAAASLTATDDRTPATDPQATTPWTTDGGSFNRSCSITCAADCMADADDPATLLVAPLGQGLYAGADSGFTLMPALIAASGVVVTLDSQCNLILYDLADIDALPDTASLATPVVWQYSVNFTAAEGDTGGMTPCTPLVLDETGTMVFFANPVLHHVYGFNIAAGAGDVPVPLNWSPLSYNASLLLGTGPAVGVTLQGNNLWLPLAESLGALIVNVSTGIASLVQFLPPSHGDSLLLGPSVALALPPSSPHAGAVGFTLDGYSSTVLPRLVAFLPNGTLLWVSSVADKAPLESLTEAGTLVDVVGRGQAATTCILAPVLDAATGLLSLCAAAPATGQPCANWPADGCVALVGEGAPPAFTWVRSSAAILPARASRSGASTIAYYTTNTHLVEVLVTDSTAAVLSMFRLGNFTHGTSPVLAIDAWSPGHHAVVVPLQNGTVLVFEAENIANGPMRVFHLTHTLSSFGVRTLEVLGPYVAVSDTGTLLLLARDADLPAGSAFLLAMTTITGQPKGAVPSSGGMSPGGKAALALFILFLLSALAWYGYGKWGKTAAGHGHGCLPQVSWPGQRQQTHSTTHYTLAGDSAGDVQFATADVHAPTHSGMRGLATSVSSSLSAGGRGLVDRVRSALSPPRHNNAQALRSMSAHPLLSTAQAHGPRVGTAIGNGADAPLLLEEAAAAR